MLKFIKRIAWIFIFSTIIFLGVVNPVAVSAQGIESFNILDLPCLVPNQAGCESENDLITIGTNLLQSLGSTVAILVILWGGYKYFISGVAEGAADGRKTISAGVIGLVIVNIAPAIEYLVTSLFTPGEEGVGVEVNSDPLIEQLNVFRDFLFGISTVVAVLVIVVGGYQYMASAEWGGKKNKKDGLDTIKNGVIGLVVIIIAQPIIAIVEGTINTDSEGQEIQFNSDTVIGVITNVLQNLLFPIAAVATVFFLVLGGYEMISSRDDSEKYKKGLQSIQYAVLGLIIALLATTIVQLTILFTPVDDITPAALNLLQQGLS